MVIISQPQAITAVINQLCWLSVSLGLGLLPLVIYHLQRTRLTLCSASVCPLSTSISRFLALFEELCCAASKSIGLSYRSCFDFYMRRHRPFFNLNSCFSTLDLSGTLLALTRHHQP